MGRAPCCDKANVKRGPWSPEEDATLRNYVQTHGIGGNWIALPRKAGLRRCGKSCRLRWLNYLRPDIKHGGFTEEEDKIICAIYNQMGSRWSVIASQLPGRTDNDVKNYWNTKLKKKAAKLHSKGNAANNPNPFSSAPPPTAAPMPVTEAYRHGFPPLLTQGYTGTSNNIGVSEFGASSNSGHNVFIPDQGGLSTDHATGISYVSYLPGTRGGEDDGVLMDFGMGNLPYDIISGLWFQEKDSTEVTPGSSSLDEFPYLNIKPQGL
ncbi:hypothetical protein PVL29_003917 [Vitis rotundifolia]|uniref:Uncharacterized protein n=1 Tax=Vitis rotundifolia TaxID=103349 RepID=A0AA39A6J9_VITRO|nr:hypothetical protein PVL29_003917 [Vitis rotundifolia]